MKRAMGITAVQEMTQIQPAESKSEKNKSTGTFTTILGKKMVSSAAKSNPSDDQGKTTEKKSVKTGDETEQKKSKQEDTVASDREISQDGMMAMQAGITGATMIAAGTAAVEANPASALQSASQPAQTVAVAAVNEQPAAAPTTDQVVANVLSELRQTGETVQQTLKTMAEAQSETENEDPSAIQPTDKQSAYPSAAAANPDKSPVTSGLPTAGKEPAADAQTVQTNALSPKPQEQPAAVADAKQQSDSGASASSESSKPTKETESVQSQATEGVSASFHTNIAAKASQQTELQDLSAAVDKAIDRFQSDFQGMQSEHTSLKIALEPRELGALTITLVSGANGVTAKIKTDNPEVANLIGDQVHRMVQSMEAKGVRVENVDVVFSQMSSGGYSSGQSSAGQSGNAPVPQVIPLFAAQAQPDQADALSSYESAAGYYAVEDGIGQSVEYRI